MANGASSTDRELADLELRVEADWPRFVWPAVLCWDVQSSPAPCDFDPSVSSP